MKKRILLLFLMMTICIALFSIITFVSGTQEEENVGGAGVLNGKDVLFVGCSFTYYGATVIPAGAYNYDEYTLAQRENDQGFFYQLCKANGATDVNVVDWTFGGHNLDHILGGEDCTKCNRTNHLNDLQAAALDYDYVILNEIRRDGESAEQIRDSIRNYMELFSSVNPNVKFYYIVHSGVYVSKYSGSWLESVELIEDLDVTILDWGTLVWDIANGYLALPNAQQTFAKNTFMVSQPKDTYHPNILTGYLYALMTYCAITGDSAAGQPYGFCWDEDEGYPLANRFEIESYKINYYTWDNEKTTDIDERMTNFDDVFQTPSDMLGLQQCVNTYLDEDTDAWKKHIP